LNIVTASACGGTVPYNLLFSGR